MNTSCHLIIVACANNEIYFNNNEIFPIYGISITDKFSSYIIPFSAYYLKLHVVIESGIDVPPTIDSLWSHFSRRSDIII